MALSNIWSNARRVITQGLVVTYKKELRYAVNINNISHPYWHYERRRTMESEYLGLTRGAAEACCAAWNKALYRRVWRQVWVSNASDGNNNDGIVGYWNDAGNVGDWYDDSQFDFIQGGTAKLSYDGGKGWKVSVSIDETLPYNHRPFDFGVSGRGDFLAFENDPSAPCQAFRWGGEFLTGGGVYEDFSLDAAEYQLALTSAEIVALGSTPLLKVGCVFGGSEAGLESLRAEIKTDENSPWISCDVLANEDPICFSLPDGAMPKFVRLKIPIALNWGLENYFTYSNILEVK
jgi:hypothetical protein